MCIQDSGAAQSRLQKISFLQILPSRPVCTEVFNTQDKRFGGLGSGTVTVPAEVPVTEGTMKLLLPATRSRAQRAPNRSPIIGFLDFPLGASCKGSDRRSARAGSLRGGLVFGDLAARDEFSLAFF